MAVTNYSFQKFNESTAKAYGKSLPISTKSAINICTAIKGKSVDKVEKFLSDVIILKRAVPFTRFTDGVGHRKGNMASGRFPQKAAVHILNVVSSAKANASALNLDEDLIIVHACAHKASSPLHQGRQRRRAMKRTHIEIVVQEAPSSDLNSSKKTSKKLVKKDSKPEVKQVVNEQDVKTPKPEDKEVVNDDKVVNEEINDKEVKQTIVKESEVKQITKKVEDEVAQK